MVETTQHRDATPAQATPGAPDPRRRGSAVLGTVSLVAGAIGVVVGCLPVVGVAGVLLAVVAVGAGVPGVEAAGVGGRARTSVAESAGEGIVAAGVGPGGIAMRGEGAAMPACACLEGDACGVFKLSANR